jgi:hypothetical protein
MREPLFGPNAGPFFQQLALGIAVSWFLVWIGLGRLVRDLTYFLW